MVAEYLRHLFREAHGNPVDGIAWESARRDGGHNVVLFVRIEADAPARPAGTMASSRCDSPPTKHWTWPPGLAGVVNLGRLLR